MKPYPTGSLRRLAAFLLLFSVLNFRVLTFAQGNLTPPGAPEPTMKTLDQIEARTPISSAPFTIVRPGSYYLTTNLTVNGGNAINIATNGVALDLNGFTLFSKAASAAGYAIDVYEGLHDLTIKNGFIQGGVTNDGTGVYSGSGFAFGIDCSGNTSANVMVSHVSVAGVLDEGIFLGTGLSTVVESCTVHTAGDVGIFALVIRSSTAIDCGGEAIAAHEVTDSNGESTGSSAGLDARTVKNCFGQSSAGAGVYAALADNCHGESVYGAGLSADTANDSYGHSTRSYGLYAHTANHCYGVSDTGDGVHAIDTAISCEGSSGIGTGLFAALADDCDGISDSGFGLYADQIAIGCYGFSGSGTGFRAFLANTCDGSSIAVTNKFNMP